MKPNLVRLRAAFFILAIAGTCVLSAAAQSSTRRQRPAVPVASPTPPLSEPMIVSRADDFPDVDAQPVQPVNNADRTRSANNDPVSDSSRMIEELQNRIKALESDRRTDPDAKQKRLALSLDILTRSEQRAEGLRKQLFEMIDKENTIKTRLDAIDTELRPEVIERATAFAGSLRPEELRATRRRTLESEKTNQQNLLAEVQKTKAALETNLQRADALVERLRTKLEKEIDTALSDDETGKP